jgi:hypothetical protein
MMRSLTALLLHVMAVAIAFTTTAQSARVLQEDVSTGPLESGATVTSYKFEVTLESISPDCFSRCEPMNHPVVLNSVR